MEFTFLDQLSLQQQHCKIKTRLARLWESTIPQLKNQMLSLECLLIDAKVMIFIPLVLAHTKYHFLCTLSNIKQDAFFTGKFDASYNSKT